MQVDLKHLITIFYSKNKNVKHWDIHYLQVYYLPQRLYVKEISNKFFKAKSNVVLLF